MTYIPIPQPSESPPSPRARELSQRIEAAIEDFLRSYPDTESRDIREAVRLAVRKSGRSPALPWGMVVGLLTFMAALGAYFFLRSSGGTEVAPDSVPWILILVVGLTVVVGLLAIVRRLGG